MAAVRPLIPRAIPSLTSVQISCLRFRPTFTRIARQITTRADPVSNGSNLSVLEKIEERDLVTEASESYLSYAMSVIVGRALPDVRDGLKPVHRRILFGMHELRMTADKPFKKCARVVGEVLGKYHPHGDAAVYSALVRMAQAFSMRYTLINGHGNFGSLDNDPPAAMRYTECKLRPIATDMLLDHLEENTVDFIDTFDASQKEPIIFPAKIPNLLINGSSGIAVGVATRIPPHNMHEIVNALKALIKNPEISVAELMGYVPAPDFPTGGQIMKNLDLRAVYETGNGSVVMRGKAEIKENGSKRSKQSTQGSIVITELPYLTNKAQFVESVASLVNNQTLDGITDILDESDRDGTRVVVELKRGASASVVLNNLYKHTSLQSKFSCNMVALVNGKPSVLNLKEFLTHFLDFRMEVIRRRSKFQLKRATDRLLIVDGLLKALENLDAVVSLLKESEGVVAARASLSKQFDFTDDQSAAIAAMPLSRMTQSEVKRLQDEQKSLKELKSSLEDLLSSDEKILKEILQEAVQIARKFGDTRRSELVDDGGFLDDLDVVPNAPTIITFSKKGYVKRMEPAEFAVQRRGGKGKTIGRMRDGDAMNEILNVQAHDQVLFFTIDGRVFTLRAYQIPSASRASMGTPISQVVPGLTATEVTSIFTLGDKTETEGMSLLLVSKKGRIKRTPLSLFKKIRSNGLIATKLASGDELRFVEVGSDESSVLLASNAGRVSRFNLERVRAQGRNASGVRGQKLSEDGEVVGVAVLPPAVESDRSSEDEMVPEEVDEEEGQVSLGSLSEIGVLLVTKRGIGKVVDSKEFSATNRGSKGVYGIRLKDGDSLVGISLVSGDRSGQEILLATEKGMMTRIPAGSVRKMRRFSFGVKVMNVKDGDKIQSITTALSE